ncbi:SRPBCC family protein [Streptomyces marispadix]|uniref:SRPBCC family protein n=1 Tax=Streptomyces marispadix TaxID=2922868 RepID=A0ABS9STB8_9ACTN|nr:SRPBCC family protein [Streptomyces marispadix]MCH6159413.1 SRPBCC family protein [Streptomyces marispadix]
MAESTLSRFRDEVANSPAADRLKDELRDYLQARAHHAVTGLGSRIGEGLEKLADPREGRAGGLAQSLAKGGEALSEGKSPAQAAMSAGTAHVKEMFKDKVKGLFGMGGKAKSGGGKSKSVTIVEDIDVGVPVRVAYDQWTQFQEFSTFAKGVVSVDKSDEVSTDWRVKVAKSTRSWKAAVTEQIPDRRIAWTTEGAKGSVKGVVTFHRLTDDLTRVLLVLEYFPVGFFEKTGNIWRAQGRRARLDLKLYRRFITMRGEATDGWRGEIRDGEVVVGHDEAVEEEQAAEEAAEQAQEATDAGEFEDSGDLEDSGEFEDFEDAGDVRDEAEVAYADREGYAEEDVPEDRDGAEADAGGDYEGEYEDEYEYEDEDDEPEEEADGYDEPPEYDDEPDEVDEADDADRDSGRRRNSRAAARR